MANRTTDLFSIELYVRYAMPLWNGAKVRISLEDNAVVGQHAGLRNSAGAVEDRHGGPRRRGQVQMSMCQSLRHHEICTLTK